MIIVCVKWTSDFHYLFSPVSLLSVCPGASGDHKGLNGVKGIQFALRYPHLPAPPTQVYKKKLLPASAEQPPNFHLVSSFLSHVCRSGVVKKKKAQHHCCSWIHQLTHISPAAVFKESLCSWIPEPQLYLQPSLQNMWWMLLSKWICLLAGASAWMELGGTDSAHISDSHQGICPNDLNPNMWVDAMSTCTRECQSDQVSCLYLDTESV